MHLSAVLAFALSAAVPTDAGYSWIPTAIFMVALSEIFGFWIIYDSEYAVVTLRYMRGREGKMARWE